LDSLGEIGLDVSSSAEGLTVALHPQDLVFVDICEARIEALDHIHVECVEGFGAVECDGE
jgi:hypothetical protein